MTINNHFGLLIAFLGATLASFGQDSTGICHCPQQSKLGKGTLYIGAGYNWDWFSKTDLTFKSKDEGNFDFTLYDVEARDNKDAMSRLLKVNFTIPQYSFRIGYYFNNKNDFGLEISYDHVKYIMLQNQTVHMKGEINGVYYDKDTLLVPHFLMFEHTNGANFCQANFIKRQNLFISTNKKHWIGGIGKAGFGFVYPKTDTWLFGVERNDVFHIAGYVASAEVGVRYDFLKYFFAETTGKLAFANYTDVLIPYGGRASHHFFAFEYIANIGIQFTL